MATASTRVVAVLFGLIWLGTFVHGWAGLRAFERVPEESQEKGEKVYPQYMGVNSCRGCHKEPGDQDDKFVQLTEYSTWFKSDKHSEAYNALSNERSTRMAKILGKKPTDSATGCLSCHAVDVPDTQQGELFKLSDGVSCDGCHGPSKGWDLPHRMPSWRVKKADDKKKLGMIDVRDPVERTKMCLSCHIGDVEKGRVVTHQMYAAGHPPLPSIEVASFSEDLPRHWRLRREVPFLKDPRLEPGTIKTLPPELRDPKALTAEIHKIYRFDEAPFEQTRLVVVGGVLDLQKSVGLVADLADEKKLAKVNVPWPDFAVYDCYACHHELKTPSWRQQAGYVGAPGRPQPPRWPTVLARLGARHLAGPDDKAFHLIMDQFHKNLDKLHAAFSLRPFGERGQVIAAANGLTTWNDGLLKKIGAKKFDQAAAQRLLTELRSIAEGKTLDYDSARQVAWAFRIIQGETCSKSEQEKLSPFLMTLDRELRLTLPSGKQAIEPNLRTAFERIGNYDPAAFVKAFTAMGKALSQ